jgi:hypothetical protein
MNGGRSIRFKMGFGQGLCEGRVVVGEGRTASKELAKRWIFEGRQTVEAPSGYAIVKKL